MEDHDHHRPLMTSMEEELELVEGSPSQTASSTIYRVPKTIRKVDMNAYDPQVISIGPYHRNNHSLQAMEAYKWKSLRAMLHRHQNRSLEDYIRRIQSLEAQARSHYSEEIDMGSDDFVKMMVLDGCFIVEFLLNATEIEKTNEMKPIRDTKWMMPVICQDMLLLENQLPFFIIQQLFDLYGSNSLSLVDLAFNFFGLFIPLDSNIPKSESVHHLLHLVHACLLPTRSSIPVQVDSTHHPPQQPESDPSSSDLLSTRSSIPVQVAGIHHPPQQSESDPSSSDLLSTRSSIPVQVSGTQHPRLHSVWIPSATEIERAGIRFKTKYNPDSLMDVTFDYGVIEIPRLFIQDFITNTLFRNAVAFELCHVEFGTYFASYTFLMKCLLKSPKDVELLVENGIIEHRLGNHKAVVVLFNSLSKGVVLDFEDFHFSRLFVDVAAYSDACNQWRPARYRDYLSLPDYFSLLKAFLKYPLNILGVYLAFVQTTIAVAAYYHPRK